MWCHVDWYQHFRGIYLQKYMSSVDTYQWFRETYLWNYMALVDGYQCFRGIYLSNYMAVVDRHQFFRGTYQTTWHWYIGTSVSEEPIKLHGSGREVPVFQRNLSNYKGCSESNAPHFFSQSTIEIAMWKLRGSKTHVYCAHVCKYTFVRQIALL